MVKLTRGQEVKIITQRQLSEELQRRKEWRFPSCTEIYIECKGRTEPCITCPYKEGYKMPVSIKTLEPGEYSEDRKRALKEAEEDKKKRGEMGLSNQIQQEIKVKKIREIHKIGIADSIRNEVLKGNIVVEDIYNKIKNIYVDRDEKYLKMRITTTIDYLRKRGEIQ